MNIYHVFPENFSAFYKVQAQDAAKAQAIAIATIAPKHRGWRLYLADSEQNLLGIVKQR